MFDHGKKIGKAIRTLDLSVTNNAPVLWLDASAAPPPVPNRIKTPFKKNKHA